MSLLQFHHVLSEEPAARGFSDEGPAPVVLERHGKHLRPATGGVVYQENDVDIQRSRMGLEGNAIAVSELEQLEVFFVQEFQAGEFQGGIPGT